MGFGTSDCTLCKTNWTHWLRTEAPTRSGAAKRIRPEFFHPSLLVSRGKHDIQDCCFWWGWWEVEGRSTPPIGWPTALIAYQTNTGASRPQSSSSTGVATWQRVKSVLDVSVLLRSYVLQSCGQINVLFSCKWVETLLEIPSQVHT